MHQGQLSKEPTADLNKLSLPTSIPGRDHSSQKVTIVFPLDSRKTQDEGSNVGLLGERVLCVYGTIDVLCETSSVFTNSWKVHEALDARCAVDLERRSGAHVGTNLADLVPP